MVPHLRGVVEDWAFSFTNNGFEIGILELTSDSRVVKVRLAATCRQRFCMARRQTNRLNPVRRCRTGGRGRRESRSMSLPACEMGHEAIMVAP